MNKIRICRATIPINGKNQIDIEKMMKQKSIDIFWTEPIAIEDILNSPYINNSGLYMITRVWGEKSNNPRTEKCIYIGKTANSFRSRLKDHITYWIPEVRGKIYVRFGLMEKNIENNLLEDIESAIIYAMQPQENSSKMNCYTFRTDFLVFIHNIGDRGPLEEFIDSGEQVDINTI